VFNSRPVITRLTTILSRFGNSAYLDVPKVAKQDLLLTLRIYALYCADRRILWLFGISALVAGGISGYILAGQDSMQYSVQIGCNIGRPRLAGLWLAVFVYDTIIFGLTALRTYQCWREARDNPLSLALNLFSLFFRDGAMYFACAV
ncbi:hypothetical protein WG66_001317, partial [Moniliophthora roreri]